MSPQRLQITRKASPRRSTAVYPQARFQADHFHTVKNIWGHLKKALLSYRRKIKARGEAKNDQEGIELAKTLWKLRWSLLKKPTNLSAEEKQAIAALEREHEGFVQSFRSIIRQLVNIFDHSHSEAQAKIRRQQLRQDIQAVDDDHLDKILTFFDDHWDHALRYLRKKGMGKHRRGSNSESGMRLLRRLEKNHDGIRSAATRQHYIQIYQAIKYLSLDIAEFDRERPSNDWAASCVKGGTHPKYQYTLGHFGYSGGSRRHLMPPSTTYKMALTTARLSSTRCRPPGLGGGSKGLRQSHSAPVRSVGYGFAVIPTVYRTGAIYGRLFKQPLSAVARTEPAPALLRQRGQDGLDLALPPLQPDICLAPDGQDIGLGLGLQPQSQPPISAINTVARDPFGENPSREGPVQHLLGQLRCGGKRPVCGDPGLPPACPSIGPCFGQYRSRSSKAWPSGLASPRNTPIWPFSTLPAVPIYWRATPAECSPFVRKPVSSRTSTPLASPGGWMT